MEHRLRLWRQCSPRQEVLLAPDRFMAWLERGMAGRTHGDNGRPGPGRQHHLYRRRASKRLRKDEPSDARIDTARLQDLDNRR